MESATGDEQVRGISPESDFQTRISRYLERIAVSQEVTGRGSEIPNHVARFEEHLSLLPEGSRQQVYRAIAEINNPPPSLLEQHGIFFRKMAYMKNQPDIEEKFSEELSKKEEQAEDEYFERALAAGQGVPLVEDNIALLQDPELLALVDSVVLPQPSEEREELARRLAEANLYTFGDDQIVHHTDKDFVGGTLYTIRDLDDLAFSGGLEVTSAGWVREIGLDSASWTNLEELQAIGREKPEVYKRIVAAINVARRNIGFHPVSSPLNKLHRTLIGLDNSLSFSLQSLRDQENLDPDRSFYGDNSISKPIKGNEDDLIVSLGDDVMIRIEHPETIVRYANGLISVAQFREFVLDQLQASGSQDLRWVWNPPFSPYHLNDRRLEVQVRGSQLI